MARYGRSSPARPLVLHGTLPPVTNPKVETVVEAFDSGLVYGGWVPEGGTAVSFANGYAQFTANSGGSGFYTPTTFTMIGSSVAARFVTIPTGTNMNFWFGIFETTHAALWIAKGGNNFVAQCKDPTASNTSVSTTDRDFRIREEVGQLVWESADASGSWTERKRVTPAGVFDLANVGIDCYAENSSNNSSPLLGLLDNLNTPLDFALPTPDISLIGRHTISPTLSSTLVVVADETVQRWELRIVANISDTRDAGTLIEEFVGDAGGAWVPTITVAEAQAAGGLEGPNFVKAFVQDLAGNWSV